MKRLFLFLIAVIVMLGLLTGCSNERPVATEPSNPVQIGEPTEPDPTFPVDEEVFYFSNEQERCRLYSMRLDGSDLKLVVDAYCYDVRQVGNSVYYMSDGDLCVYHIPTGKASILIDDAFDYAVDGKHLVYYLDAAEIFQTEVRYRNLETGEDKLIEMIMNGGDCAIANGILYYTKYVQEFGKGMLGVCDLETLETWTIADELQGIYRLQAADGGVYFEGSKYDGYGQFFASADGSIIRKIENGLTDFCTMFQESDGEMLCCYTTYVETGSEACVHRHNNDGSITELLRGKEGGYFTYTPLRDNNWLISHAYYDIYPSAEDPTGDEWVYRTEYYLLDRDGNTLLLDMAGELGSMFPEGDFPIMDSSTARKPVTADIYNLFVLSHGYEGTKPLCSTTHGAWLNIADRKVDIALLAAPTEGEMDYLKEGGVTIEMKLYGGDGLVFIGNSANPVQDLTQEQIISIYQGKITNWSQVGGPDQPITVYYRDDQSGSQRLFEKMVFKGLELPDYEKLGFAYMDEMSTIVDIVINDPYSIGYSIMTYLDDVYDNEELKVFAVDGVVPSVDSVKDGSYAYHTQGYVVIRSDEPEGSPVRRLYDWFGSPVCDEILIGNGITPLHGENGIG